MLMEMTFYTIDYYTLLHIPLLDLSPENLAVLLIVSVFVLCCSVAWFFSRQ
jgi:hypothetical protein